MSAVVARRIELNAQDTEPAALSSLLTQLLLPSIQLHLLPKSSVDVFLLVLESDSTSNVLSAGLTVSSLAIADAGIPMFGLCVGSVVARAADGEMLFDPSKEDDTEAQGQVTVGVMPALSKVTSLWTSGEIEVEDVCDVSHALIWGEHVAEWKDDRPGFVEGSRHAHRCRADFARGRLKDETDAYGYSHRLGFRYNLPRNEAFSRSQDSCRSGCEEKPPSPHSLSATPSMSSGSLLT